MLNHTYSLLSSIIFSTALLCGFFHCEDTWLRRPHHSMSPYTQHSILVSPRLLYALFLSTSFSTQVNRLLKSTYLPNAAPLPLKVESIVMLKVKSTCYTDLHTQMSSCCQFFAVGSATTRSENLLCMIIVAKMAVWGAIAKKSIPQCSHSIHWLGRRELGRVGGGGGGGGGVVQAITKFRITFHGAF